MRTEFQVNFKSSRRSNSRKQLHKSIKKEPLLRQYLILAYQIREYLNKNPTKSARTVASWLGYTPSRISQFLNLLRLAPSIQEDILLSEDQKIYSIPENKLRPIMKEENWEKQREMWLSLTRHH